MQIGVYINAMMQQMNFLLSCQLPGIDAGQKQGPGQSSTAGSETSKFFDSYSQLNPVLETRMHIEIVQPSVVIPPLRVPGYVHITSHRTLYL